METTKLMIKGSNLKKLVDLIKEGYASDYYFYNFENVYVFAAQKFFFRVSSNLMSLIVLNFKNSKKCIVEITSGGGGSGILAVTWGSESSSNNKIVKNLKKVCDSNSWKLTRIT